MPLIIISVIMIVVAGLNSGYITVDLSGSNQQQTLPTIVVPTSVPAPNLTPPPTPIPSSTPNPTRKPSLPPTPIPSPTATQIPTPMPSPTPTSNTGKEQALKMIDEKINKINEDIAFWQSNLEAQIPQLDYCGNTYNPACMQAVTNTMDQMRYKINLLVQERNEYERQKIQIMA